MPTLKPVDARLETGLLKSLITRENYENYFNYVNMKQVLPTTKILLNNYKRFFELYPDAPQIDFGVFYTHFTQEWEQLNEQDLDYYREYVFPAVELIEADDTSAIINALKHKQYMERLSELIANNHSMQDIKEFIDSTTTHNDKDDEWVHTAADLDMEELDKTNALSYFLPSLQKSLLGMSQGQFIVVFAPSNTGKTAFVLSQAVHTFRELHKRKDNRSILYFNSEGTSNDVMARFYSNLYKKKIPEGFEKIVERRKDVRKSFMDNFNSQQFKILPISKFPTYKNVEKQVVKHQPALVIIDICDKMSGCEDPTTLKKLYDELRVLSGDSCPIIGTSQSGVTEHFNKDAGQMVTKLWLTEKDLYGSKVGKGGAADTVIGIGREEGKVARYIHVCKNKRGESIKLVCELESKYSNYKEITY